MRRFAQNGADLRKPAYIFVKNASKTLKNHLKQLKKLIKASKTVSFQGQNLENQHFSAAKCKKMTENDSEITKMCSEITENGRV